MSFSTSRQELKHYQIRYQKNNPQAKFSLIGDSLPAPVSAASLLKLIEDAKLLLDFSYGVQQQSPYYEIFNPKVPGISQYNT